MTNEIDPLAWAGNIFSPVELTSDWEYAGEAEESSTSPGGWKARFRRLWFVPGSGRYEPGDWNTDEYEIFAPNTTDEKPSLSTGSRAFAVFRGRWELLASDGASSPHQTAIVMEAIRRTQDVTSDPSEYTFGKIRVPGKEYPPGPIDPETEEPTPPVFDDCCCLALGKDPNEPEEDEEPHHQQLYKGQRIEITGPFKWKNPDFNPEDEESDEPEFLEYYEAEPIREYWSKLDDDVQWDMESDPPEHGTTTITMKDSDEQDVVMFVSGEVITQGFMVSGNAESYKIILNEDRLIIVGGRCQQKVE